MVTLHVIGICLLSLLVGLHSYKYPFLNPDLPFGDRVDDLVGRLTLEEIQGQIAHGTGAAPAIDRLGIKPFVWWSNCAHGDAAAGNATSFPESIGLSAAFSPDLMFRVARVTALETRAKNNYFVKQGSYHIHQGLSCFSPTLDLYRDPRWGRDEGTWGEDTTLASSYAEAFVHGVQGDNSRYSLLGATCKTYTANGGPDNYPVSRFTFDAKVSMRDLQMSFLPGFKACVRAGTHGILCAYNSVNGVPACASKELLTDILRTDWGFTGYVISDVGAIEDIMTGHHYYNNSVDTVAGSLKAGCNINAGSTDPSKPNAYLSMVEAVKQGKLDETFVRESIKPLWYTRMRLGEFDPPNMVPYSSLNLSIIQTPAHRALSLEAAMKSFVLLKNKNNFLPLKQPKYNVVSIIGPMIDNPNAQTGNYAPDIMPEYTTTPIDGLSSLGNTVKSTPGCLGDNNCLQYNSTAVKLAVTGADVVFVCLGLGNKVESEGHDRTNISLPEHQLDILKDAVANSPPNAAIVLILFNAGTLDLRWPDSNDRVTSILEVFYPSQATGVALYNVITMKGGSDSVPAGRLPMTWPMSEDQIPPITNYSMEGRTYRYLNTEPLYPFGYGLSYTTFKYSNLTFSQTIPAGSDFSGTVDVENTGPVDAEEVVQIYFSWVRPSETVPKLQLGNFSRVFIPNSARITVPFAIKADIFAVWADDSTGWKIEGGAYTLSAGGQQPNQKRSISSNVIQSRFNISGSKYLGRSRN
ncbi:hypothetical protein SNE40_020552 [Patella caerulea]|uniref:Fibronectin type III-like domain-containing protein n=1 Tax=Patella caerulea TaxID=87958 RepID=A0AAN8GB48_PATCE